MRAFTLILTILPALTTASEAAPPPAAGTVVSGWVETVHGGGRVYPGGRQRTIMETRAKEILPLLVEAFADDNHEVGHVLARVAALAPENEAVEALSRALEDERTFVREFAGIALGLRRARGAIPALTTAFRMGKLSTPTALDAFRRIGGEAAVDVLAGFLTSAPPATRAEIATALGSLPGAGSARALVRALRDADEKVKAAALVALGTAGGPGQVDAVLPFLKSKDAATREAAVRTLRGLGGDAAREALLRHFAAERGERLEALEGALDLGAPAGTAGSAFLVGLLADGDPDRRCRATRALTGDRSAETTAALRDALGDETDETVALTLAVALVERGESREEGPLPAIRALPDRFADCRATVLALLDRAGDPTLAARLRETAIDPEGPAGGPLFWLAFHATQADRARALEVARQNPRAPGVLADAYLLVASIGGSETVDTLVRSLRKLPSEDFILVPEGPALPGLRTLHVIALRTLAGRAFGFAPNPEAPAKLDPGNPRAFRRALRWWLKQGREDPARWSEGAVEAAKEILTDENPRRREGALRTLARAGRTDDLASVMEKDADPAVRIRAARWLVEIGDLRGARWLIGALTDEGLADWTPFLDSPRPTRLEAVRALWRAANRRFDYRQEAYDEDVRKDLILEEARRWRLWWSAEGPRGPDASFREGCRLRGVELPDDPEAEARVLARELGGDHPRFFRTNLLARLRRLTGKRMLPVEVIDLEVLAPGDDHPIFGALAHRWQKALGE